MPGRLKVKILAGKHLPVMDRASESTDAFVEVKFGSIVFKTDVCSKSLNPLWNSDWFKFEVNDELLQDEPLQVRVLDHDTYSAHDAIGKVYIDVDPLLNPDSSHLLGGWFPIYDTMHGIRGELLLVAKLELFADVNQFKQTSCGFKFICGTVLPSCYQVQVVHGFVADLIISEDPEYKWIEKLRTPRASNEARQRLFMKMSGELQRRIGSKVESVGGNAVIGYRQSYDIEGDSGIVIRGIGTAVSLRSDDKPRQQLTTQLSDSFKRSQSVPLSSSENPVIGQLHGAVKGNNEALTKFTDFPFYTLTSLPEGMVTRISSVVCSRSVKLLEKVHNQEDWETRELWWHELRQEILSHCLALSCNAVAGYREETSICDDVIVLSAEGTAVEVDADMFESPRKGTKKKTFDSASMTSDDDLDKLLDQGFSSEAALFRTVVDSGEYPSSVDYQASPLDGQTPVPGILLSTLDIPRGVCCVGKGTLVQARFCRKLKKSQSESFALQASDLLPFIEYELHRRISVKVKMRAMNSVFGFHSNVTVGENLIVGLTTGTAVRLSALPYHNNPEKTRVMNINEHLDKFLCKSMEKFNLESPTFPLLPLPLTTKFEPSFGAVLPEKKSLFVELSESESSDSWILEESFPPPSCSSCNLDRCPGIEGFHEEFFFSLRRIRYDDDAEDEEINQGLSSAFNRAVDSVWFRIRRRNPSCSLSSLQFTLSLPDDDELQIWISGSVVVNRVNIPLDKDFSSKRVSAPPYAGEHPPSLLKFHSLDRSSSDFEFDSVNISFEEQKLSRSFVRTRLSPFFNRILRNPAPISARTRFNSTSSSRMRHQSESSSASEFDFHEFNRLTTFVVIATTSRIPGRKIKRHIGVLSLFIVRETSAVRGAEENLPMAEPEHGTGSSWFVMRTLAEAQALIRSHVAALGGNALTSCRTSYVVLKESSTKNEAQCLLHVIGDVMDTS